jgi:hypothetical protein
MQNQYVMKIKVGMSSYATRACGTSVDCNNLQLTSQGWVAKYGSVMSVGMQAHEPNLHWPQPTVVFQMSAAEMNAAKKAFGPYWMIDTVYFPDNYNSKEVYIDDDIVF